MHAAPEPARLRSRQLEWVHGEQMLRETRLHAHDKVQHKQAEQISAVQEWAALSGSVLHRAVMNDQTGYDMHHTAITNHWMTLVPHRPLAHPDTAVLHACRNAANVSATPSPGRHHGGRKALPPPSREPVQSQPPPRRPNGQDYASSEL